MRRPPRQLPTCQSPDQAPLEKWYDDPIAELENRDAIGISLGHMQYDLDTPSL
jgi:hypothetical protein